MYHAGANAVPILQRTIMIPTKTKVPLMQTEITDCVIANFGADDVSVTIKD